MTSPYIPQPLKPELTQLLDSVSTGSVTAGSYKLTSGTNGYVLTSDGSGNLSLAAPAGGTPTAITVANEQTDTTCFVGFFTQATGDLSPKTNLGLTFNSATGALAVAGNITANGRLEINNDQYPTGTNLALGSYHSGGYDWIQSFASTPLKINPLGNAVSIGDSLSVTGNIAATGNITASGNVAGLVLQATGTVVGSAQLEATGYRGFLCGHTGLVFSTNHLNVGSADGEVGRVAANGNWILATSAVSDNGAKLQVTGNITATGTISSVTGVIAAPSLLIGNQARLAGLSFSRLQVRNFDDSGAGSLSLLDLAASTISASSYIWAGSVQIGGTLATPLYYLADDVGVLGIFDENYDYASVKVGSLTATGTVSGAGVNSTNLTAGFQLNGTTILDYSSGVTRLRDLGGGVSLNATTGTSIYTIVGASVISTISSTGLVVTGNITANGNITATGTISGSNLNAFTAFIGPTTSIKTKTLRNANDTIVEVGGSYTITGTWTNVTLVTPTLGVGSYTLLKQAGTEPSATPTGTTATLDLNNGNKQTINLGSASGNVTLTLTIPAGTCSASGRILAVQGATCRNLSIVATGANPTVRYFDTKQDTSTDAASSIRSYNWDWNGTYLFIGQTAATTT